MFQRSQLESALKLSVEDDLDSDGVYDEIEATADSMKERGHVMETMRLMSNLCTPSPSPFQDYLREQNMHEDSYDLIGDVVAYIHQNERDLKMVLQRDSRYTPPDVLLGETPGSLKQQNRLKRE